MYLNGYLIEILILDTQKYNIYMLQVWVRDMDKGMDGCLGG